MGKTIELNLKQWLLISQVLSVIGKIKVRDYDDRRLAFEVGRWIKILDSALEADRETINRMAQEMGVTREPDADADADTRKEYQKAVMDFKAWQEKEVFNLMLKVDQPKLSFGIVDMLTGEQLGFLEPIIDLES